LPQRLSAEQATLDPHALHRAPVSARSRRRQAGSRFTACGFRAPAFGGEKAVGKDLLIRASRGVVGDALLA